MSSNIFQMIESYNVIDKQVKEKEHQVKERETLWLKKKDFFSEIVQEIENLRGDLDSKENALDILGAEAKLTENRVKVTRTFLRQQVNELEKIKREKALERQKNIDAQKKTREKTRELFHRLSLQEIHQARNRVSEELMRDIEKKEKVIDAINDEKNKILEALEEEEGLHLVLELERKKGKELGERRRKLMESCELENEENAIRASFEYMQEQAALETAELHRKLEQLQQKRKHLEQLSIYHEHPKELQRLPSHDAGDKSKGITQSNKFRFKK